MFGWNGKGLEVDLGTGEIKHVPVDSDMLRHYLGGRGLGVKLMWDRVPALTDPLSPQNILVFAAGPLTGTRVPASGRHAVVSKSPLTGTIFDGNAGGFFGAALKRAGYDYILFKGRARGPVILLVEGEEVSLNSARHLWGRNTAETITKLGQTFAGDPAGGSAGGSAARTGIACIGRAGEVGVPFASIMNDRGSTCGRGGLGAVMGSKHLKGVVVRGRKAVPVADEDGFRESRRDIMRLLVASPVSSKGLSVFGTAVLVNLINYMKLLPTENFRRVCFEGASQIAGEKISDTFKLKKRPCYGCPIACKMTAVARRDEAGESALDTSLSPEGMEVPEYETIALLGSGCGSSSLEGIMRLNNICNDYGLDTITAGGTLACYAEILGRKLDQEEMERLLTEAGEKKGQGLEIVGGSAELAAARNAPGLAMHVKNLELPGYDPRGALGMALGYITSNRGGCHLRAYMIGPEIFGKPKLIDRLTFSGKAGLLPVFQNFFATVDSLVVCKFASFSVGEEEFAAALSAVTGIPFSTEELLRAGERIFNLERLFNIREGFTAADDALPGRFFEDSDDGLAAGIDREQFRQSLEEYYRFRGWSPGGIPGKEKLQQLGLARCGVK